MGNIFWDSKGILSDLFVRFVVKLRIAVMPLSGGSGTIQGFYIEVK
jgi:hypothetical protein